MREQPTYHLVRARVLKKQGQYLEAINTLKACLNIANTRPTSKSLVYVCDYLFLTSHLCYGGRTCYIFTFHYCWTTLYKCWHFLHWLFLHSCSVHAPLSYHTSISLHFFLTVFFLSFVMPSCGCICIYLKELISIFVVSLMKNLESCNCISLHPSLLHHSSSMLSFPLYNPSPLFQVIFVALHWTISSRYLFLQVGD